MNAARTFHRGQALTEFLVLALALVPLLLLIPVIAKYQDMVHAAELASRYVAFEAMTRNDTASSWKSPVDLADEVRRRFFSNSEAPIKTGETAANVKAQQNAFWRDQLGDPLIKNFQDDVSISFGASNSPSHSGTFSPASDGAPFDYGAVRNALGLEAKGIYTANVRVVVANLPAQLGSYAKSYGTFNNINLTLSRSTSLLVDSWAAEGHAQVESRINKKTLFPGSAMSAKAKAVDLVVKEIESPSCFPSGGPCTRGPKLGKLDFWSDIVPPDRLE